MHIAQIKFAKLPTLLAAYEEAGPADGPPVILLHGFPYDPRAYDAAVSPLAQAGYRVIVPYLRGYGPTRFHAPETLRSGQQAALGQDLLDLMNALSLPAAVLAGYDWGGRAACIVAALWPERVTGLVSAGGYNIQDIAKSVRPAKPEMEYRFWYQYYFHTPRGEAGLTQNRHALCRFIWQLWSPMWSFDEATYAQTAASFENPDFVDVVIHSYRHRYGYAPGDPALEPIEQALAPQPIIMVPTIVLDGCNDGVDPLDSFQDDAHMFSALNDRRRLPGCGHNLPQEVPEAVVKAVLDLTRG
jgi:pimeloyl-ACP methyl ester carboxylesterase